MSHSCLIHSSIDGLLGCFHILATVKNTAMNIGGCIFFFVVVWFCIFILFYFFFFFFFILLFKYSCLHYPTTTLPCHTHPHLPPSILHIFFWISVLVSFRYILRNEITGSKGISIIHFFEVSLYFFLQWLYQSTFPPTVQKIFLFSTSSLALVVYQFIDDRCSDRCEMVCHCGFN